MRPLPNVRKLFLPDKGHIIVDCDLSGADAQVVAWEAGDEDLKAAFRAGLDVHKKNGTDLWGERYNDETMRWQVKGVHAINYVSSPRTLAGNFGMTVRAAEDWMRSWFRLHPGIKNWHKKLEFDLQTTRKVSNIFGYRIVYFDRPDNLLPKAAAWVGQSTTAAVCGRGSIQLHKKVPWVQILLQVHDSLVFQFPYHRDNPSSWQEIKDVLRVEAPYPNDPLVIPWGLAMSPKSWGDVEKKKWEEVC